MGAIHETTCENCGLQFELAIGGGMAFEVFHCRQCDRATSVERELLEEARRQHDSAVRKQCGRSACEFTDAPDAVKQQMQDIAAASGGFDERLQQLAGTCACGGQFSRYAVPRCPDCQSTNLTIGDATVLFD